MVQTNDTNDREYRINGRGSPSDLAESKGPYNRFNPWKILTVAPKLDALANTLRDPKNPTMGELPTPANWHIYPSNACNNQCNFCIMDEDMNEGAPTHQQYGEKQLGGILSRDIMYKAVRDAERLKVKLIHWSGGGEPLMNPYLPEILKYQKKETGVAVALSTNGILLERILGQGRVLDHLRVSVNAGNKKTYEAIGQKYWDKTVENIRQAIEEGTAKHIGMGFVLTHLSYETLPEYVRLAEDLGVEFLHIRPAFWPKYNDKIKDIVENKIDRRALKSDKVSVHVVSDKFDGIWNQNASPCRATPIHAVLGATGEFILCQDRMDLRWGDYEKQSFEEIWESPKHYELIKKAQSCDIRWVETNANNIIDKMFIKDDTAIDIL